MKVYLAGLSTVKKQFFNKDISLDGVYALESFYYMQNENNTFVSLIKKFDSFLLDSGAFTFLSNCKNEIDWDSYIESYASFIRRYDINLFFELDIDPIVGIKEVERLRLKLEKLTNKKPIPVWHKSRGKDYFIKMCKEYPYVAIGGIVTKEIPTKKYETLFPWFIATAHKYGCKIHGLGYTNQKGLHRYKFDSVDSTAWLYGNKGGFVYRFMPSEGIITQVEKPIGTRLVSVDTMIHNTKEWIKFSKYARVNM